MLVSLESLRDYTNGKYVFFSPFHITESVVTLYHMQLFAKLMLRVNSHEL